MQIVLGDYVGAILGLARDGLSWRLNPREVHPALMLSGIWKLTSITPPENATNRSRILSTRRGQRSLCRVQFVISLACNPFGPRHEMDRGLFPQDF
jgi:hypothetical protein